METTASTTKPDLHRPGRLRGASAVRGLAGHDQVVGLIAYVRVSTARDEMVAPEIQIDAMRAWARQNHVSIVDIVQDLDQSGRGFAKRSVSSIIERIRRGEASGALVYNFSRFGRNAALALAHIAELEQAGGHMLSATEPVDPESAIGRFTRTTALAVAELQSDQISDGWKAAIARRVKHGLPGDGQPRFGYIYHRASTPMRPCPRGCIAGNCATGYVLDPDTAPILRDLYLSHLDGISLPALAERLHLHGVPTVRGGRWVTTTVRDMLDNGFGAGLIAHHGQLAEGNHPSVITEDQWAAYVRRRDESRATAAQHRNPVHATAGIAVCGLCGNTLVAASTKRDGPAYILRCGRMQSSGRGACPGVWVVRKSVEAAVLDWLMPLKDAITTAAAEAKGSWLTTPRPAVYDGRASLERRRADLLARIKRLTDAYEAGALPLQDFIDRRADVESALDRAERDLQAMEREHSGASPAFAITDVVAQWDQFSPTAKRDVLRVLIDRIVVHPRGSANRVQIEPRSTVNSPQDAPITRE